MTDSLLPDPTRAAAPPAGSTTRNGEQLTAERTPSGTLSVPPEHLPRPFGRYELRQLLGRGGMGSVYLAHDSQLDRLVALKIPKPFGDDPALWRERFLTEARAAATLSHPNICPVHDVGEHDGRPYLTMAYIDGETLAARLKRDGRLPVNDAVGLVAVVARAMAEAHARGIVHRDLKPGNLLLDRRGRPVVTDFGLALRASTADDLRLTLTGVAMGTPAYMPPEQAGGDVDAVGPASDVYALGVMLFELLTGRVPFRGRTFGQLLAQIERDPPPLPSALADGVPPALDAVVLTALAKAPADRFPTAAEFADALEQFQAGQHAELTSRYGAVLAAADATAPHPRPAPTPPKQRTRWWPAVAAGFLGLLVLMAGVIYVSTDKGELKVEFLDPDTGQPIPAPKGIDVKINGQRVVLDPDGKPISVRAGEDQMLVVTGEDFVTESRTFTLKRWKDATVRVSLIPKERLAKRPEEKPKAGEKSPPSTKPPAEAKAPPKPVEFPKDKTLIEAGGWQILCDATQEQMRAWLDERKKAKQSVMWLDAYPVDGQPLYTAVAAPDDRMAGWEVVMEVSVDRFLKSDLGKPINFNTNYPRSLSGFDRDDGQYAVMLWHPMNKGWNYMIVPDPSVGLLLDTTAKNDEALAVLRPFPNTKGGLRWAFTTDRYQIKGSKPYPRIAASELAATLSAVRKDGKVPLCLAATGGSEGLLFALATGKNGAQREWQTDTDLTAEQLKVKAVDKGRLGFRPDTVTAYAWDGAVRYCVVWVKDPPKPTPYPKDKTLLTAGGYETLLDATQEQMQAWLDEKKKAKHSVLWLDAIEVAGKPVFSAVAALDDRAPNWVAFLDLPAEQFATGEAQKKVGANDHPLAISGYTDASGTKPVTVTLWRQERLPFYFLPDGGPDGVKEAEGKLKGGSGVFRVIRPFTVGNGTMFGGFGYLAPGERASYLLDATAERLGEFEKARRAPGERVTSLAMHVTDGKPVYTVVGGSFPDKQQVEWRTDRGLSTAQLREAIPAQAKDGFRPTSVTACPWDGAVRYCVVWVKDPPKPTPYPKDKLLIQQREYETLLDATKEQMQAWLDEKKKAKQSVLWLDATAVGDQPVFAAVAALDDRQSDWVALLDQPAGKYDEATKELQAAVKGRRIVALSGYLSGASERSAVLLHPGTSDWTARPNKGRLELGMLDEEVRRHGGRYTVFRPYPGLRGAAAFAFVSGPEKVAGEKAFDLTADELTKFAADTRTAGHRLGSVAAYPADGGLKFAAVNAVNPDNGEWDHDTDLTATQLIAKTADRSKLGFRPASVTAYAWDGVVRYCVVWVKAPPKKPDAKKDEPKK